MCRRITLSQYTIYVGILQYNCLYSSVPFRSKFNMLYNYTIHTKLGSYMLHSKFVNSRLNVHRGPLQKAKRLLH